jgi:hypothetical protein
MNSIEKRLRELRAEEAKGQKHLDQLDYQRKETREALLRISGAIQVLEELLKEEEVAERGIPAVSTAQ